MSKARDIVSQVVAKRAGQDTPETSETSTMQPMIVDPQDALHALAVAVVALSEGKKGAPTLEELADVSRNILVNDYLKEEHPFQMLKGTKWVPTTDTEAICEALVNHGEESMFPLVAGNGIEIEISGDRATVRLKPESSC